jgi:hypothetical protein
VVYVAMTTTTGLRGSSSLLTFLMHVDQTSSSRTSHDLALHLAAQLKGYQGGGVVIL